MKKARISKTLKEFIFFTVCPFFIPFINQIDSSLINNWVKWALIIGLSVTDFYFAYRTLKVKENCLKDDYIQESVRFAYSGAHEIIEKKRDSLAHETEFNRIEIKKNILPYDIHLHINDICREFKKVISSITQINNEFITITFIYRYTFVGCSDDEKKWKWICGKEPTSNCDVNEFVKKEDSTFYKIINSDGFYIFGNSKEELAKQKLYHLGERDKMYNNIGSVFSFKVAFGNNFTPFVEGVITVTTHGKQFTDNMDIIGAEKVLRNMIIDEIFPYYQKLLESELGLLYLRHNSLQTQTVSHPHQCTNENVSTDSNE